jgi:glucokinase
VRAAVVDAETGRVLVDRRDLTHAAEGPEAVIDRMAALIARAIDAANDADCPVAAIGIGVPGLYDPETNVVRFLPNLPTTWPGVPLGREIQRRLGLPTTLINDSRAFILAEATFGAGRGGHTVVGMTVGTGIGGGAVIGGRLHLGLDGTAGEVGHHTVEPHGLLCGCGNRGCLEAHASGPAIAALGMRAIRQGRTTILRDLVGGDLNQVTPEVIVRAAEAGDPTAAEILDESGAFLGLGVANLITLFSPNAVIIGGGVADAGEWILRPIRRVVAQRCRVTPIDRITIATAALAGEAGVIGAAVWAGRSAF